MKQCPYCHKDLPDDSTFCVYCGKPLKKIDNKELKKSGSKKESYTSGLKHNPRENSWGKLGLMLFLIALIGLDFIVATVINAFGVDSKFVFYISLVLYIGAMICGALSFLVDHKDKKRGYEPNGSTGMAMISIFLSFYIILVNVSNVILK